MATSSVARSHNGTLVASTVDTVTFTTDWPFVEVKNKDASIGISFTVDGTTPTYEGDEAYWVGPNEAIVVASNASGDPVKLISSGTPKYIVTGVS